MLQLLLLMAIKVSIAETLNLKELFNLEIKNIMLKLKGKRKKKGKKKK